MSETRINVSQTTITAEEIGASSAVDTMPIASASNLGKIVQYVGNNDGYDVAVVDPHEEIESEDVTIDASKFKNFIESNLGSYDYDIYNKYEINIYDNDSGTISIMEEIQRGCGFRDYRELGITLNSDFTQNRNVEQLGFRNLLGAAGSSESSGSSGSSSESEPLQVILSFYAVLNKNYDNINAKITITETSSGEYPTIDSKVFANKVSQIDGIYSFKYMEESVPGWYIKTDSPNGPGYRLIDLSEYGITFSDMPHNSETLELQLDVGVVKNGYFYKCTETGSSIVSGNATVTEYINMEGETPDPEYIPTFIFDKTVFDAYVLSQGKPENTSTSIIFTWDPDDETGDTLLTAHYNTNDSVSTILIDEAGEPLNQTYAILGFTTNFADPTEDPEAADQQWMNYEGHITIILPTVSSYAWENIEVQGDCFPDQKDNAGKFLTTDGKDVSWGIIRGIQNTAENPESCLQILGNVCESQDNINIGYGSSCTKRPHYETNKNNIVIGHNAACNGAGNNVVIGSSDYTQSAGSGYKGTWSDGASSVVIGPDCNATGTGSITIGHMARTTAQWAVMIGRGTNNEQGTIKFGWGGLGEYQYKLLNSDGTIPEARLADTTNAQQGDVLTLDANGNAVWQAGGGGSGIVATTGSLLVANWDPTTHAQTITVTGLTATKNVLVSPAPASTADYIAGGIICSGQLNNTLTFTCTTIPSADITVNMMIFD